MASTSELKKMSREGLVRLRKDIDKAIGACEARLRREALAAAEAAARKGGFSLFELTADIRLSRKLSTPPKYRNPENPSLNWSGRGRQPRWFRALIDSGTLREDLEIG